MDALRRPASPDPIAEAGQALGEFAMTAEDVRRITVRGQTALGIELGEAKRQMIYSRLSRRLRALKMTSFATYLDFLESPAGAAEHEQFANALTTNLTAFFREAHHFEHFEREIVRTAAEPRRLRVWSAGCSTGEEPYSLAMVLHANADRLGHRDRRILATDLDTGVLERASRGSYPVDRYRALPQRFRTPAFLDPAVRDEQRVSDPVRALVTFRALNLIGPWPLKGPFDHVFCRNVLIYFSAELRDRMIDRFADLILPGGVLYLGHSESILGSHPKLVAEGHTIYRRVKA
jgi:chemotaxis protein methyltransferase CheR